MRKTLASLVIAGCLLTPTCLDAQTTEPTTKQTATVVETDNKQAYEQRGLDITNYFLPAYAAAGAAILTSLLVLPFCRRKD
jgi:hypothetical protein